MIELGKATDHPCEGCGAPAGEPCNPYMGCKEMAAEADQSARTEIHEVGWAPAGRTHSERVSRRVYFRDLEYAKNQGLNVFRWSGEDRDGHPLTLTWVATPNGALLAAYEITGRG